MLTPERIDCIAGPADYFDRRVFARAIEAEVRKDYDALIRQMLEAMENVDVNAVGKAADEYDAVVGAARARLES